MTRSTRRRFLALASATTVTGLSGYSVASEHNEEEHADEHDDDDHDGHEEGEGDEHEDHEHDEEYEAGFNHADVEFMRMMIPHHEQAIVMAEMIPGRTDRTELCRLGPEIIEVQREEIETMEEWLHEAGADPHAHDMDHEEMDGMLTEEELQELRCAEGQEFDCLFVDGMIHHHEGAIEMAEDVLEDGQKERIAELAGEIIELQREEIRMMEEWQDEWGC